MKVAKKRFKKLEIKKWQKKQRSQRTEFFFEESLRHFLPGTTIQRINFGCMW